MKFKIILLVPVITLVVTVFTGCQPSEEVSISDTNIFPEQMVGIWENQQRGWILRIEEDGRLSKIRHTIGRADLSAGEISSFPLIDGGQGIIEPGPWQVEYLAATDEMVVDISLVSFEYDIPGQGIISGSSRDIFIGTPPEMGEKTWTAQWISKPDFVASTEDQAYTDYKLPFEAGDEEKGEIVFKKIDPKMFGQ